MESARASAQLAGWSEAKTNAFLKAIHDNYDNIANGTGTSSDSFSLETSDGTKITVTVIPEHSGEEVTVGNGAGKGGYGAENRTLDLNHAHRAINLSFTYSENGGPTMREDVRFPDRCSNPVLNKLPDVVEKPVVAPAPVPSPEAPVKDPYAVYSADLKCESGCNDQIGVVTRDGLPAGSVWEDKNDDGQYWKTQRIRGSADFGAREEVIDREEVHLPNRETIDHDIEELRKHGFTGRTVVYSLTDTEGNNVVACYDVKTHDWKIFNADHSQDPSDKIPNGHPKYHRITSLRVLEDELANLKKRG